MLQAWRRLGRGQHQHVGLHRQRDGAHSRRDSRVPGLQGRDRHGRGLFVWHHHDHSGTLQAGLHHLLLVRILLHRLYLGGGRPHRHEPGTGYARPESAQVCRGLQDHLHLRGDRVSRHRQHQLGGSDHRPNRLRDHPAGQGLHQRTIQA